MQNEFVAIQYLACYRISFRILKHDEYVHIAFSCNKNHVTEYFAENFSKKLTQVRAQYVMQLS